MKKTQWKKGCVLVAEVKQKTGYEFADKEQVCSHSNTKLEETFLAVETMPFKENTEAVPQSVFYNRETTPAEYKKVWEKYDTARNEAIEKIRSVASAYNIKITIK